MDRDRTYRTWQDDPHEPLALEPTDETHRPEGSAVPKELEGRYNEGTLLGRGGLGQVLGVRDHVINREVALKVLSTGAKAAPSRGLERRFLREARITAQLEHPGIVPVHDIGRRADGTLYYTMKRVRGKTLGAELEACRTLPDRLALLPDLLQVAHAVAYAHSRDIVHRDLKPENVMVGEFGETLVLDWGIARSIRSGAGKGTPLELPSSFTPSQPSERSGRPRGSKETAVGTVMGTPAYMSPEQAAGRVDEVDSRSDVWSLGVMLYELLTGRQPFDGTTEQILKDVKLGVRQPVLEVCPEAPPDLAAVVERAMAYRRSDRYPSAKELAAELEAWLTGHRVQAYHYGRTELAQRFVSQNRAAIAVAALALFAFVGVGVGFALQLRYEREAAVAALAETLRARADAALPGDPIGATVYAAGSLALTETPEARGVAMYTARRWKPVLRASFAPGAPCQAVAWSPDGRRLVCASPDGVTLVSVGGGAPVTLPGPQEPVGALALGADGSVVVGTSRGRLIRWDAAGARRPDVVLHRPVTALSLSTDGSVVLALGPSSERRTDSVGELVRVDAAGAETAKLPWSGPISDLAAAGGRLLFVARDSRVGSLDPTTFEATTIPGPDGRTLHTLDALPDGSLAVGATDGSTATRSATGEGWLVVGGENGAGRVRFAGSGLLLADVRENGRVRLIDPVAMASVAELPEHAAGLAALSVSPDGASLAVGGDDGRLRVWALDLSSEACSIVGLYGGIVRPDDLRFTPDGAVVVVASAARGLHAFEAGTGAPLETVELPGARAVVGLVGDGRLLVVRDLGLSEVDLASGAVVDHGTGPVSSAALLSADEALFLDPTGQAVKWSLRERREIGRLVGTWGALLPGPTGSVVLLSAQSRAASTLDVASLRAVDLASAPRGATSWAVSADGHRLALGGPDRRLTVTDTLTDRLIHEQELDAPVSAVALSADGSLVAAATTRQEVVIFDTGRDRVRAVLQGHRDRIDLLAFDPTGRQLLTASRDGEVRAWDLDVLGEPGAVLATRAERDFGHHLEAGRIRP